MKKFLSLALVLALAVTALASCTGDSETTTTPDAGTQAPAGTTASTDAPSDATEAPADETEAPADETEAPADETEAPADETEAPASGENGESKDPDTSKALYTWQFRDEDAAYDANWQLGGGALDNIYENGVVGIELENDDPQFFTDYFEEDIDVTAIDNITVRVKNTSTDLKGQIFFGTDVSGGADEGRSVWYEYANSGEDAEWEEIVIPVDGSTLKGWEGILNYFRFDVSDHGQEGIVYIDYIVINGK